MFVQSRDLSADTLVTLAIKSARRTAPGKDGNTHLVNAVGSDIVTPLTSAYEAAILAQTGANDVAAALAAVRLYMRLSVTVQSLV